jgi:hypothetical protein
MQTLGYVTAITMAAAGAALGVMAVRSLPDSHSRSPGFPAADGLRRGRIRRGRPGFLARLAGRDR